MTDPASPLRIERRGLLLVLSSPSGAGKTTLAKRLLAADAGIRSSVSVTTRPQRPGEVDGVDYHFIDMARFDRMRETGELIEWAQVFDNCYGTPKAPVMAAIAAGQDILFDIDWQGAQQLREELEADLVRVFILPPTGKALEERLKARNLDHPDVVARRMAAANAEISHWAEYDYVIVNDEIEKSFANLSAIVVAERLKRKRQLGLTQFVREIQSSL
jgi:guanylate kinase